MNIPQPRTPLWRAASLVVLLGGIAAAGLWWGQSDEPSSGDAPPALHEPGHVPPDRMGEQAVTPPPLALHAGELSAPEVARQYQTDRHAANARYQGQRLTVRGVVEEVEPAQDGALLITFLAEDDARPLRALLQQAGPSEPQVGETLGLDCLNQGLVMEEPLLIDCRIPS